MWARSVQRVTCLQTKTAVVRVRAPTLPTKLHDFKSDLFVFYDTNTQDPKAIGELFAISFQVDSATQLSNSAFNNYYVQSQRCNSHN